MSNWRQHDPSHPPISWQCGSVRDTITRMGLEKIAAAVAVLLILIAVAAIPSLRGRWRLFLLGYVVFSAGYLYLEGSLIGERGSYAAVSPAVAWSTPVPPPFLYEYRTRQLSRSGPSIPRETLLEMASAAEESDRRFFRDNMLLAITIGLIGGVLSMWLFPAKPR